MFEIIMTISALFFILIYYISKKYNWFPLEEHKSLVKKDFITYQYKNDKIKNLPVLVNMETGEKYIKIEDVEILLDCV